MKNFTVKLTQSQARDLSVQMNEILGASVDKSVLRWALSILKRLAASGEPYAISFLERKGAAQTKRRSRDRDPFSTYVSGETMNKRYP